MECQASQACHLTLACQDTCLKVGSQQARLLDHKTTACLQHHAGCPLAALASSHLVATAHPVDMVAPPPRWVVTLVKCHSRTWLQVACHLTLVWVVATRVSCHPLLVPVYCPLVGCLNSQELLTAKGHQLEFKDHQAARHQSSPRRQQPRQCL